MQIIIIGRGQGGTRVMAHTLQDSGVFMGKTNYAGDLIPPQMMYEAVQVFGRLVKVENGNYDFSVPLRMSPPDNYCDAISDYLKGFNGVNTYGWKLPETVMALPWLVQLFPDAYYIHWVRDGRDNILHWHGTEDNWYGVDIGELPDDRIERAAMSWHYHEELIDQTPKPERWLRVRFEDFITQQYTELERLEAFLGLRLDDVRVFNAPVGRYHNHDLSAVMPILEKHLFAHGYLEEGIRHDLK